MVKCVFCGREEQPFIGIHLLGNDGSVSYYCSSKCRKNDLKLGRDKRKLKWTEAYRINRQRAADKLVRDEAIAAAKSAEKKEEVKKEREDKQIF